MAIIRKASIFFAKLDPKRPNKRMDPTKPRWEVQLRTHDKAEMQVWKSLSLSVKPVLPDDGPPYWRVNLAKKVIKSDGTNAQPVEVIDGHKKPLDPNIIGNGSIANIRIHQYEYEDKATKTKKLASMLMAVQVTKLIVYTPEEREDFDEEGDTEVVDNAATDISDDDFNNSEKY